MNKNFIYILVFLLFGGISLFAQTVEQSVEQEKAVAELTSMFVNGPNILLLFSLLGLGAIFKHSKNVPDWLIISLVPGIGCLAGVGLLTFTTHGFPIFIAFLIGGCDGLLAVFGHQYLKQMLESPVGPSLMKFPFIPWLAAILGINMTQQKPTENSKNP